MISHLNSGNEVVNVWKPPNTRHYKINSDAVVFGDGTVALGGVMRDAERDVMTSLCVKVKGRLEISEAEGIAARQALQSFEQKR